MQEVGERLTAGEEEDGVSVKKRESVGTAASPSASP